MSQAGSGRNPARPLNPGPPTDVFSGTPDSYPRYRVPYPDELLDDLRHRAGVTGEGRMLDLACGPGRVALPLAMFFGEVWAVDQEPEMIEVGRKEAMRQGPTSVRWMVGRAEEVEASPGSFELITIGEAFHRLDQRLIAEHAMEWLAPGHGLATMGCFGLMMGNEPWHDILREVIRKWTNHCSAARTKRTKQSPRSRGADHDREVLKAFGFKDVGSYDFPHPHVWTLDSIVGNLHSTSSLSTRVLGDEAVRFEADLRRVLLDYDPSGRYPETMRFNYVFARRPE